MEVGVGVLSVCCGTGDGSGWRGDGYWIAADNEPCECWMILFWGSEKGKEEEVDEERRHPALLAEATKWP